MTTSQQSRLGDAPEEGVKAPVKAISSGNLALFDVGMVIAGYTVLDNDRIAANGQTNPLENGIYTARLGRSWVRTTDFDNGEDVINGQLLVDANTSAVYAIQVTANPWVAGTDQVDFGLLLSPVGFFWGAIGGTLSNQGDLQAELNAKAAAAHTHVEADITDLQAYLLDAPVDANFYGRSGAAWAALNVAAFAPVAHTHVEADITDLQAYLLDAPNDGDFYARRNAGWEMISTAAGTTGEIVAWPHEDIPQDFLACNGQSVNAVTFAALFAVIGYRYGGSGANFNVPDLRGQFVRGWANGSGQDPDRTSRTDSGDGTTGDFVGTKQSSQNLQHSHTQSGGGSDDDGGPRVPGGNSSGTLSNISNSGGSEARPRNVYMQYIIRYSGGGSGDASAPSITIQDNGIEVTSAVELMNFLNFTITQPVANQIEIAFGASPNAAAYCPGYTFNFIDTDTWSIENFDVSNLFSVGRRLRFVDGASNYYGTITAVDYNITSPSDTTMDMSMEGGDVLTNSITEVCLVNGAAGWSPIAQDPFSGSPINGIATGLIGSTQYWVICGNAGRVAYSTDGGLTWTLATSGTSEDCNDVAYNPDDESFLVVCDNGTYTHTTDGTTWTADTTKFKALPEYFSGNADIFSVCYDLGGSGYRAMWSHVANQVSNAYTTDDTATWDSTGNQGTIVSVTPAKTKNYESLGGANSGSVYPQGQDMYFFTIIPDEAGSVLVNLSSQTDLTAILTFDDSGAGRLYGGHLDGDIYSGTGAMDTTTFGGSAVREFALSNTHQRIIAVGDDGKIAYQDEADWSTGLFTLTPNGANPLANFTGVAWNGTDGLFIAVNDSGQILRSTNGIA